MYDGTGIVEVETREIEIGAHGSDTIEMVGWFVCNGHADTPNLFDKFIRGAIASGGTGGSNDAVVVDHNHNIKASQDYVYTSGDLHWHLNQSGGGQSGFVVNSGVSGVNANIPSYYSVIYIIRMS